LQRIKHYKRQIITSEGYVTDFEKYVLSTIAFKNKYHFFFYKDAPTDFFVFDDDLLEDFNEANGRLLF